MSKCKLKPILAVDLGGTKIRSSIVLQDCTILSSNQCLTHAEKGQKEVIKRIISAMQKIMIINRLDKKDIGGIAVASAGIIDIKNGLITASPSLPGWKDVPLRQILMDHFRKDVFLINDASAAALGEYFIGVGKGLTNLIYITVSTGIGGGIILGGNLYIGNDGCAGEIGHMVIDTHGPRCNCGNYGCLEIMASGNSIAKEAQKRIIQGETSILLDLVNNCENISAKTVYLAAKKGDKVANDVIKRAAFYLGIGIANIVNIFNPQMVVVGGGVSKMGGMLLKPAKKVVRQRAFSLPVTSANIVRSRLGDNAGIIGATLYSSLSEAERH